MSEAIARASCCARASLSMGVAAMAARMPYCRPRRQDAANSRPDRPVSRPWPVDALPSARVSGTNLYASLSSLLAAAVAVAIGISVYLRDRSRLQFSRFFAFCLSLGLFHLARFFAGLPSLPRSQWVADTLS